MRRLLRYGAAVLLLMALPSSVMLGQDDVTPVPTDSFVVPPTPTFGPDMDVLEDVVRARFAASTLSPLTGEPFTLTLIVEVPPGRELVEWPEFPEDWGDFVVQTVEGRSEEIRSDGIQVFRQDFTALLWSPGDHITPDTFIRYGFGGEDVFSVPVRELFISVPTIIDFNDQNLRPMKPPIYLPYISPWVVLIGMLVMGGASGFGWRWWRNRPESVADTIQLAPAESALMALETVHRAEMTAPERYAQTADVLRRYVNERFDLPGPEMTTPEILEVLRDKVRLDEAQRRDLGRVLVEVDLVKYAGASADDDVSRRLLMLALRWIERVEAQIEAAES